MTRIRQDTAREIILRYAGFVMIACSVVVGQMLVRLDEVVSGSALEDTSRSR
jgi:hypothetical protein